MDTRNYFTILLGEMIMVPAGILCIAPMKNRLRHDMRAVMLRMAILFLVSIPASAYLIYAFDAAPNLVFIPLLILMYIAYCSCLTASPAQAAAVFSFVSVIMSVVFNLSNAVDALYNPQAGAGSFSLAFGLTATVLGALACILLIHLMSKYGSYLIDRMDYSPIWWITVVVSGIFIFLEVFTTPYKYETLFVNRVFGSFAVVNGAVLILEMLLGTIYYYIVNSLLRSSELQIRSNLLEMQESAFEKQQRYMNENARIRHDFKHTLRSLHIMAEENDIEQIRRVLEEYVSTLPEKEIINYCNHYALNAMLNYYASTAISRNCAVNFRIDLPSQDRLPLSDTEFCSVIGNILDNAVHAIAIQTEGERRIDLTTRVMNDRDLYITAVNTFDGNVKHRNHHYLTTKKRGSGIGLRSIASIIELHGGMSEFHHEGTMFYSDIFLPLQAADSIGDNAAEGSDQR